VAAWACFHMMDWVDIPSDGLIGPSERPKPRGVVLQMDPEPNARVLRALPCPI
jgi:hypothetical protein